MDGGGDLPHQLRRADTRHPARSKIDWNPVGEPSDDRRAIPVRKRAERGRNAKRQPLARELPQNRDLADPTPAIRGRCPPVGEQNGPDSAEILGIRRQVHVGGIDLAKEALSDLLDPTDLDFRDGGRARLEGPCQQCLGPGPAGSVLQLRVESTELLRGQAGGGATGREVDGPDQLSAVFDPLLTRQSGLVSGPIG